MSWGSGGGGVQLIDALFLLNYVVNSAFLSKFLLIKSCLAHWYSFHIIRLYTVPLNTWNWTERIQWKEAKFYNSTRNTWSKFKIFWLKISEFHTVFDDLAFRLNVRIYLWLWENYILEILSGTALMLIAYLVKRTRNAQARVQPYCSVLSTVPSDQLTKSSKNTCNIRYT